MTAPVDEVWEMTDGACHVGLSQDVLDIKRITDRVRSPAAGAIVIFAGMSTHTTLTNSGSHLTLVQAQQETTSLASQ